MNAERLLAHYEKIVDAPDAIARLRHFILDLAVRGKLVPQDPNDEPASELLKRIAKEKVRLVRDGKFNTFDGNLDRGASAFVFSIPTGWSWCYLDDVAVIARGGSPRPIKSFITDDPDGIPWIKIGDSTRGSIYIDETQERIKPEGLAKSRLVIPGDLLLSNSMSFGFPYITNVEGCIHDGWLVIRTPDGLIDKLFLHKVFLSDHAKAAFSKAASGAVVQNLNADKARQLAIPLPPLAEQHRIVAKVDELMGLCDRLEAARAGREAARDGLAAASLARLNAPDAQTFQADARFALDALPALTTRPDQIKALGQTILNLAVRGKLVPQNAKDEPAINFDRAMPNDLGRPFEIPRTWQWARLHTLGKLKGGGTPSKGREDFWNGNIPWVSPKDMKTDYIAEAQMNITEAAIAGSAANLIDTGSVLFVVRGMILAHSFPVALSLAPLVINQDMKALVLKKSEMGEYVLRALKGIKPEMLKRVQRSSHGTCRLDGRDYSDFLIPIPPLAEQHRIVAKVDELMALCDRLEASLAATAATRRRLLDALLADALTPTEDQLEAAE